MGKGDGKADAASDLFYASCLEKATRPRDSSAGRGVVEFLGDEGSALTD